MLQPVRLWWIGTLLLALGCPSEGDGDGGSSSDSSSSDSTSSTTVAPTTTVGTTMPDTADTSTGENPTGLQPCDPTADDCAPLRCGGAPTSGYYCRPPCSDMAEEGEECSDGGVCLQTAPGSEALACVVLSECDPATGDGCSGGDSCVVVDLEPVRTACEPAGDGGTGATCGPVGGNACDVGLGCLGSDLADGDPGLCTPWCTPPGDGDASCPVCVPLGDGLGSCAECDVLDDMCPEGTQCQPVNETLGGFCIDYGPAGDGDPCMPADPTMSCQAGMLCLELGDDENWTCVPTCDPASPMCEGMDESCIDVGAVLPGLPTGELGLCLAGVLEYCDPDAEPTGCTGADVCLEIGPGIGVCGATCDPTTGEAACTGNAACYPEADGAIDATPFVVGNGACGFGCTDDTDCGGDTCLLVDGLESDGVCGPTCDPLAPACDAGATCVPTAADPMVGACIFGGAPCDPGDVTSCAGMAAGACVTMDGGATAACMAGCFEQDPAGCGDMAALCQVRTDAAFHAGVCVGQDPACDPLLQDCADGGACVVTGGSALGGVAYVCRGAGTAAAGESCADADEACAAGLQCFDDVCLELCDPDADACSSGTCSDLGPTLYLPAGDLGVCL